MTFSFASFRIDTIGALAAVALTLGAGAVAIGPHFLARGPTPADQKAELERRRHEAGALDKMTEGTHQRLAELTTRSATSVHLQPASRVNERLVEITKLAAGGNIAIAQMTPGTPTTPWNAPADKNGAPIASPLDNKALVVPIKLAGTGSYPDLARFIHALRRQFRDTAITALKLNAVPGGGSAELAKPSENAPASFTIDLAWYAAPAGSADPGAKP